jgi:hypothetical protein
MAGRRLNFLLGHREVINRIVQRGLEQPVHDNVWVTTNRTGKVSVQGNVCQSALSGGHVLRRPHGIHQQLGDALDY